jgi:hypothetical protein
MSPQVPNKFLAWHTFLFIFQLKLVINNINILIHQQEKWFLTTIYIYFFERQIWYIEKEKVQMVLYPQSGIKYKGYLTRNYKITEQNSLTIAVDKTKWKPSTTLEYNPLDRLSIHKKSIPPPSSFHTTTSKSA